MTQWRNIRVRNWKKFQHYKKRRPTWICFHTELLHKDEWVDLNPADKALLVDIWLLWAEAYPQDASDEEKEAFTLSSRMVQRRFSIASGHVHRKLDRLVQAGFLEYVLADFAALKTETERENPLKGFSLSRKVEGEESAGAPVEGAPPIHIASMMDYKKKLKQRMGDGA